jgi:hypothetical protein
MTATFTAPAGQAAIFFAVDHGSMECGGILAAKSLGRLIPSLTGSQNLWTVTNPSFLLLSVNRPSPLIDEDLPAGQRL